MTKAKAAKLQKRAGLPRYTEQRGWFGGDSRTLYAYTDRRTGKVEVYPGEWPPQGWGPEANVRVATRAEAEEHWQNPLHAGWKVAESGAAHATKKYGPKASEKVRRAVHELKRGELRSGSGEKVKSRAQAIAIGLSQARRAGGKVPPSPSRHATMRVDDHATRRKSRAQLAREIDEALSEGTGQVQLKDRYSGNTVGLNFRDGRVVGALGCEPSRYMGMSLDEAKHYARYGGKRAHATVRVSGSQGRSLAPAKLNCRCGRRLGAQAPGTTCSTCKWEQKGGGAHATKSQRKQEMKELEQSLQANYRALGYAGNTPEQESRYRQAIAKLQEQLRKLRRG